MSREVSAGVRVRSARGWGGSRARSGGAMCARALRARVINGETRAGRRWR